MNLLKEKSLEFLDYLYTSLGVHEKLTDLLAWFSNLTTYKTTFAQFVGGVYFIFGKTLVTTFIVVVGLIITVRIAMAIINLVWP